MLLFIKLLVHNKEGLLANGAKVQQYFSAIWEKLGEDNNGENAQKIVRYLVESARPLSVDNICFLTGIKNKETLIKERAAFLAEYIDTLSLQEHKRDRVISLVNRYEQCCERNTLPYSGFLMMKSGVMWRMGNYEEAYGTITEYERMKEKKYDVWFKYKSSNTYGMILRDMGRIDEALEVFAQDYDSSEKYGNIARCYMLKKDYVKAVEQMKQCLFVLGKQSMLENLINRGYAYYWIAEIYEAQGELEKAKIFLIMCLEVWQEYAPVLMNSTVALFQRLGEVAVDMYPGCAEKAVSEFLDS